MFKNILVATDGSNHAKRAVKVAAELAKVHGARLTILNAQPLTVTLQDLGSISQARKLPGKVKAEVKRLEETLLLSPEADMPSLSYVPAPRSVLDIVGKRIVEDAAKIAKQKRVKRLTAAVEIGDPVEKILARAKKSKCDLIVLGSRGLGLVKELVLGSVSHAVIQRSKCPTLTVK
ncbi:MAG TPA: universal stress protein [Xanthobacteraceae bacterium]|nr:universal stress protein [Xanthobacteraceae bacterium]